MQFRASRRYFTLLLIFRPDSRGSNPPERKPRLSAKVFTRSKGPHRSVVCAHVLPQALMGYHTTMTQWVRGTAAFQRIALALVLLAVEARVRALAKGSIRASLLRMRVQLCQISLADQQTPHVPLLQLSGIVLQV